MGKEASPVDCSEPLHNNCEEEEEDCKQCQAKKCLTGCAQTFRLFCMIWMVVMTAMIVGMALGINCKQRQAKKCITFCFGIILMTATMIGDNDNDHLGDVKVLTNCIAEDDNAVREAMEENRRAKAAKEEQDEVSW